MNHYLIMDPKDQDFIITVDSAEDNNYIDLYNWFRDTKYAFNNLTQENMTLQEFLAPNGRATGFNLLLTFTDITDLYTYFINHPEMLI